MTRFLSVRVEIRPLGWVIRSVTLPDCSVDQLPGANVARSPAPSLTAGATNVCGRPCGPAQESDSVYEVG